MPKRVEAGTADAAHQAYVEKAAAVLLTPELITEHGGDRSKARKALIAVLMHWPDSALLAMIPSVQPEEIHPEDILGALSDEGGAFYPHRRKTTVT